jgi:hypothetical protein
MAEQKGRLTMEGTYTDDILKKLENFKEACRTTLSSCRDTCACGRVFFDGVNSWDWDEDELEKLQEDPSATQLNYTVDMLDVEGTHYVRDCDCWHKRAIQIMGFLDAHDTRIAAYFKLEKARKEEEAKQSVTLDILYDEMKDGWREMGSAPRDATTLEVLMHDRTTRIAHWAQDLSGEDQPPFRGWFEKCGAGFSQIEDPIAWRYIAK